MVFNDQEDGTEAAENELGRIAAKLPLPPGCLSTLFRADERYLDTYFSRYPGFYDTMDAGTKDAEGYIKVMARDDDVINVAGHRWKRSCWAIPAWRTRPSSAWTTR